MKKMRDDVFVYPVNLPDGINEFVVPCDQGYTVYIDARLDSFQFQRAYIHAVKHIENGDFEKTDVQQIEHDAHKEE